MYLEQSILKSPLLLGQERRDLCRRCLLLLYFFFCVCKRHSCPVFGAVEGWSAFVRRLQVGLFFHESAVLSVALTQ